MGNKEVREKECKDRMQKMLDDAKKKKTSTQLSGNDEEVKEYNTLLSTKQRSQTKSCDERKQSDSNREKSLDRSSGSAGSGSQDAGKSQNGADNNKSEIIIVTDTMVKNMQPQDERDKAIAAN